MVEFHDDFKALPSNTPANHAHIIKILEEPSNFDEDYITTHSNFTGIDAAATLLYHWNPDALKTFLDPSKKCFTFKRDNKNPLGLAFRIFRNKTRVEIGYLRPDNAVKFTDSVVYKGDNELKTWMLIGGAEINCPVITTEDRKAAEREIANHICIFRLWETNESLEMSYEIE